MTKADCDFAVLTVQDAELAAVLDLAQVIGEDRSFPETLYRVRLPDSGLAGVVMPVGGVGRVEGAIATSLLLSRVTPLRLYLVGIAGGFEARGVALGDLLVADYIWDYEMQRLSDIRNESRPRLFSTDHDLLSAASAAEKSDWQKGLPRVNGSRPNVHFGTVLSGDKVIASSTLVANFLRENERLIGVEMEGAGVAAALARYPIPVPFLMIRGVVDYANDDKREQSRVWLTDACAATAAFTFAAIEHAHDTNRARSEQ
ncbi:hypothetical protein GCM10020358_55970 [Amorphoplanes nipponensis]|uniref:Nucleoside phosphorylase domain-containing protein n=1 Tax=Actinoplanes nipponensis TaxID=135950 RepID=A0A919JS01_9ACTN|nr:hypothetical protein [Actinoplanes nipponensis]GIE51909.1 hypothetical protein Ani05nite_54430 [Actinoplanes nipponensis]